MAREVSQRTYPEIGVTEPHHSISHHGNRPAAIAGHAKLNAHHVGLFAKFIERLRSTPDGDGSLLDHSVIVYGSGMSDGNGHTGGAAAARRRRQRRRPHQGQPPSRAARGDADGQPAADAGADVRRRAGPLRRQPRHGRSLKLTVVSSRFESVTSAP